MKNSYAPGETISATFTDAVAKSMSATFTDGTTTATVELAQSGASFSLSLTNPSLSGRVRYEVLATDADGSVRSVASGSLFVRVLVSTNRAVVAAIDKAIQTWATNPNQSITCGELAITYKNYADLLSIRAHYAALADADENGSSASGGFRKIMTRFV